MRERAVCKTARERLGVAAGSFPLLDSITLLICVLQSILCLIALFWKFDCGTTVPHFSNTDTLRKEVVLFRQEHILFFPLQLSEWGSFALFRFSLFLDVSFSYSANR